MCVCPAEKNLNEIIQAKIEKLLVRTFWLYEKNPAVMVCQA